MYQPRREQFRERTQFGNLVPVYREILGDLETPVSAFLKIRAGAENAFLLESVVGGEHIGRFSYLAANPRQVLLSKGRTVTIRENGRDTVRELPEGKDPLNALQDLMGQYRFVPVPGWRRFPGGAVGYMGYDLVRFFEELPDDNPDDLDVSDCAFMVADTLLVFDHAMNKVMVLTNAYVDGDPDAAYEAAVGRIEEFVDKLRRPALVPRLSARRDELDLQSTMTRSEEHTSELQSLS
jgi:anthranilate synthase component 1